MYEGVFVLKTLTKAWHFMLLNEKDPKNLKTNFCKRGIKCKFLFAGRNAESLCSRSGNSWKGIKLSYRNQKNNVTENKTQLQKTQFSAKMELRVIEDNKNKNS